MADRQFQGMLHEASQGLGLRKFPKQTCYLFLPAITGLPVMEALEFHKEHLNLNMTVRQTALVPTEGLEPSTY